MNNNRRNFLQVTGKIAAGGLLLPHFACNSTPTETTEAEEVIEPETIDQFGIQLYTLRDVIPQDPKGTLKQLADFGFKQIESYDHDELGIFWGMSNKELKTYLDDLGLSMVSSHVDLDEDFERKAGLAGEIGVKYLICPSIDSETRNSLDDWKRIVDRFNNYGDICKKNGLRFAYHNHTYSFDEMEGVIPQEYMMDNCNPDTVDFELDIYWAVTAGVDPLAYFKKYPNRIKLSHVKDRMKGSEEREATCTLGTGSINYPEILKVAKENGLQYFILEQERYDNTTPIDCARDGAAYLKQIKLS